MIELEVFNDCVCQSNKNPVDLCAGILTMQEKGKSVKLTPKNGEEAIALVLDGCIIKNNRPSCDGLFLLKAPHKKWMIPVELKGTHFYDAFQQLATTIKELPEFEKLFNIFKANEPTKVAIHAFVVSNAMINIREKEKLEKPHGIRVKNILHSIATKPIPDIRKFL